MPEPLSVFVFLGPAARPLAPVVAGAGPRAPSGDAVWLVPPGRGGEVEAAGGRALEVDGLGPGALAAARAAVAREARAAPLARITFCVEAFALPLVGRLSAFLPLCRELRLLANDAPDALLEPGAQLAAAVAQAALPWLDRPLTRALARAPRRRARAEPARPGPPRVLHVVDSLGLGGLQRRVVTLLEAGERIEHLVLSLEQEPRHFAVPAGRDVTPRGDPAGPWWARLSGALALAPGPRALCSVRALRVAQVAREARPDLVVGWGHEVAALAHLGANLAGIPDARVAYSLGTLRPGVGSSGAPWMLALHRRRPERRPRRVIVNADCLGRDYAEWAGYPRAAVAVVHNGVDLPDLDRAAARARGRAELGLGERELLLGTVGRLRPEKDPATLLRALARVEGPWAACALVGGGPEEAALRALADRLGLAERVRLVGPRQDVFAWLAAFDLFVLSSRHEGFPNGLLEAMASGLPCVATSGGGTPELVGDAGLLVPPGDPAALAAALERMLAEPELRARLGAAAADRARASFSRGRFVADFEGTLLGLLE